MKRTVQVLHNNSFPHLNNPLEEWRAIRDAQADLTRKEIVDKLKSLGKEGEIHFVGYGYYENGHTDDYNLMFSTSCGEADLSEVEGVVFQEAEDFEEGKIACYMSPISVHDKIQGRLMFLSDEALKQLGSKGE